MTLFNDVFRKNDNPSRTLLYQQSRAIVGGYGDDERLTCTLIDLPNRSYV